MKPRTTHPQYAELLEKLRAFLAAPVGFHGGVLHVYNPTVPAHVEFYDPEVFQGGALDADDAWELSFERDPGPPAWNPNVGEKRMRFFWPGKAAPATVERLRPVADRIGVPPPVLEFEEFLLGRSLPTIPPAVVVVDDAEEAAYLCLRVLREVFGTTDGHWLWITDIVQPDDWPSPLPKPERWPSA